MTLCRQEYLDCEGMIDRCNLQEDHVGMHGDPPPAKVVDKAATYAEVVEVAKQIKADRDNVHAPPHYTAGGIECIDYLKAKLSREEFKGFLRGNVVKYLSRAGLKSNELEDLKKAAWYLERLIREGQ